jgi:hypothetical protein
MGGTSRIWYSVDGAGERKLVLTSRGHISKAFLIPITEKAVRYKMFS